MIIQYASDLHLEFQSNSEYLAQHPLQPVGDILVLAGDIILLDEKKLEQHPFFQWCSDNFKETLIIPGNHEYYAKHDVTDTLTDYEYQLHSNVRYVNNKNIKLNH
jgi:predicted phosphohydrolase